MLLNIFGKKNYSDEVDEFEEDFDEDEYEDAMGIPFGCAACGGDYPNCRQGCSLFNDD